MTPKRKQSWLLLEWIGTIVFGLFPDTRFFNDKLSRVIFIFTNWLAIPDLKNPRYFNEKLMALKNSEEAYAPLRTRVTDKELVKDYVTELLGPGHVVPTLAILRTAAEVDTFAFPLPCVVKPTHSSQEVMIFRECQPDAKQRGLLKYWLWKSYFAANREPNYSKLEKKLIVEEVIGGGLGVVEDVKVLCFNGKPKMIQVDYGRYDDHRRDYFDLTGALLPVEMRKPAARLPFPFPDKLPRILDIAARLSAGFSFIRVDFYIAGEAILIGELTSFPTNCTVPFKPESADLTIARLFDEPDLEITPQLFEASAAVDAAARVISLQGAPAPAKGRLHEAGSGGV